jgi:hypothetical protein
VGVSTGDVLTEAMTRLRDEIVSLRQARVAWRDDLVRQVSALRADFASDRAGARRAWFGRSDLAPSAAAGPEPAAEARHTETRPHVAASQGQRGSSKPAASFKATPSFKASPAAKTHKKH